MDRPVPLSLRDLKPNGARWLRLTGPLSDFLKDHAMKNMSLWDHPTPIDLPVAKLTHEQRELLRQKVAAGDFNTDATDEHFFRVLHEQCLRGLLQDDA
jgi:hypothetical protein